MGLFIRLNNTNFIKFGTFLHIDKILQGNALSKSRLDLTKAAIPFHVQGINIVLIIEPKPSYGLIL